MGELVVGRISEVKDYGAYVTLEDYPGVEALIHVSEISLKWVRNIRDHLKEGQRNIFKVIRVNPESMQVDVSLRRVSKREREKKLLELKKKQKVQIIIRGMMERVKSMSDNPLPKMLESAGGDILQLYGLLEEIAEGKPAKELFPFLDEKVVQALEEAVSEEIKRKEAVMRGEVVLKCDGGLGVEVIRKAVTECELLAQPGEGIEVRTKGAPAYSVWVRAATAERASQLLEEVYKKLEEVMAREGGMAEIKAA